MTDRVRIMVYVVAPGGDAGPVEAAYHEISQRLNGTPGLVGNELLRSVGTEEEFVVMSEWESLAAFRSWEAGNAHRDVTAPLRPYQDRSRGASFGIYQVASEY